MTHPDANEERLLRSVALQNAQAVLLARERAERELRDSNERITNILESISDAFVVFD
jgi:PAS domain-containing protein